MLKAVKMAQLFDTPLQVSEFVGLVNQTLEYAYPQVVIEGEVSGFNINQNKFIFFDLKDESASVGCFMMVWQLKQPIEDGMRVRVTATVKLTNKGRFSVTVRQVVPVGEGELAKAFALLKAKLDGEGLFAPERKRPIPDIPKTIGVISSETAAGYRDFVKIIKDRWGDVKLRLAHVQVQGESAPDQIQRAIEYFNQMPSPPDVLVLIRGGGSLEDLWAFNTEPVVRAVAASRTPIVVGVGHEKDESLADLAADVRAATPTHAAQLVVPDKRELLGNLEHTRLRLRQRALSEVSQRLSSYRYSLESAARQSITAAQSKLEQLTSTLKAYDPKAALRRGYSVLSLDGKVVRSVRDVTVGCTLKATVSDGVITSEVIDAKSSET